MLRVHLEYKDTSKNAKYTGLSIAFTGNNPTPMEIRNAAIALTNLHMLQRSGAMEQFVSMFTMEILKEAVNIVIKMIATGIIKAEGSLNDMVKSGKINEILQDWLYKIFGAETPEINVTAINDDDIEIEVQHGFGGMLNSSWDDETEDDDDGYDDDDDDDDEDEDDNDSDSDFDFPSRNIFPGFKGDKL